MREIIYNVDTEKGSNSDHTKAWSEIKETVKERTPGYFDISWVPSHTDLNTAQARENRGGFAKRHTVGNDFADAFAKQGIYAHAISW